MLDQKILDTKALKHMNMRVVTTSSSSTSVAANAYVSITAPAPTTGTPVCLVGYMITGTGNTSINVYGMLYSSGKPTFYVRNTTGSAATITITAYSLVID